MNTLMKLGLMAIAMLQMNSSFAGDFTHIDYIPTYRTLEKNAIITHIKYTNQDLVVYMCYVASAQGGEKINIDGSLWSLTATQGSYQFSPNAIQNVRVNDVLQAIDAKNEQFAMRRGDVLSFQMRFLRPDDEVRTANLKGNIGSKSIECQDIMIKAANHRFLGHYEDLATTIKFFYTKCDYVAHPNLTTFVTLEEELERQRITNAEKNWIANAAKPIDYEPEILKDIDDLKCSRRVVLEDILFEDNSAEYQKQVDANKSLSIIVAYMTKYPQSKLVLHGHTDVLGEAEKNIEISKERVATIKRSLRLLGIPNEKVITIAYGGTQPLAKYTHGGAANRRVEVEIFCGVKEENGVQVVVTDVGH